jgi:hypothetical protein
LERATLTDSGGVVAHAGGVSGCAGATSPRWATRPCHVSSPVLAPLGLSRLTATAAQPSSSTATPMGISTGAAGVGSVIDALSSPSRSSQ